MAQAGDSVSLVANQAQGRLAGTRPIVGLHCAGGTFGDGTWHPYSIGNDINAVLGALDLTTVWDRMMRAIIRILRDDNRATRTVLPPRGVTATSGTGRRCA